MKKFISILFLTLSFSLFSQGTTAVNQTAITIANQFPDYPATPGDIYNIYFLVANSQKQEIRAFVDGDYNIDLSFIGKVNVKGLTYSEVQQTLKNKIGRSYPGSIVNVVILAPGKFKVTLLGEVNNAQIVDTMGLRTLAEVIKDKTTPYASYRDIEIKSEDGTVKTYDLFKFLRYADKDNNPFLRPNDVITLKEYGRRVKIEGQVKRPGPYELIESDTLKDIIDIYGDGLTKAAEIKEIEIKRYINDTDSYGDSTLYINGEEEDLSKVTINDGDIITVKNKLQFISKVVIQGAISPENNPASSAGNNVSNKIFVPITTGSRISTVIKDMKGTFNLTSDLKTAFVLRDGVKRPINIESIMEQVGHADDVELEDRDIIIIPFRQLKVFVAGAVNSSTAVPFIENRTAMYYIGLAGGFDRTENMFRTYSVRDVYGNKLKKDTIISPEDVIWVHRDNPISYLQEYGGYATAIVISFFAIKSIYDLSDAIANGGDIGSLNPSN